MMRVAESSIEHLNETSNAEKCSALVIKSLPIATNAMYIREFYDPLSKKVATDMIELLKGEFRKILESASWLDDPTRRAALKKLEAMNGTIGYPDEYLENAALEEFYKPLKVDKSDFFMSMLNIQAFTTKVMFEKLHKPVVAHEWINDFKVDEVNAYYWSSENYIGTRYLNELFKTLISTLPHFISEQKSRLE